MKDSLHKMIGIHIKVEGGALISYLQKGVPVPGKSFLTGEKNGKQFQQAVELRPHHAHIQIIIHGIKPLCLTAPSKVP